MWDAEGQPLVVGFSFAMRSMKDLLFEVFTRTKGVVIEDYTTDGWMSGGYTFAKSPPYLPLRNPLASLLDKASAAEKTKIFRWWLANKYLHYLEWDMKMQIMKAISREGALVKEQGERLLFPYITQGYVPYPYDIKCAFLGSSPAYEEKVIWCLQNFCEDRRDGIYAAAYNLNTLRIYHTLLDLFDSYKDISCLDGTGELSWLECFLVLWEKTPGYTAHKQKPWLKDLFRYNPAFARTACGRALKEGLLV